MSENIDLVRFLESVESEVGLLTIPRTFIEKQLQEQFDDQQRVEEYALSSAPDGDARLQRQLSEDEWHEKLQRKWYNNYNLMLSQLVEIEPDNKKWREEQEQFKKYENITPEKFSYLWEQRQKINEQKARQLLTQKEIRTRLCQALQSNSNDSFEIARIITPLLIELADAGTISIPIMPVQFASITLVIARMGIAELCADH